MKESFILNLDDIFGNANYNYSEIIIGQSDTIYCKISAGKKNFRSEDFIRLKEVYTNRILSGCIMISVDPY